MKKKLLVAFLAVGVFAVMALPTQGAKYTLTSLGDQLATIVKQVKNLKTNGTLPAKYVTYDRSVSGLKSNTAQGAIDEVAVKLSKLVGGGSLKTIGVKAVALESTTWSGKIYQVCSNQFASSDVTVTFTPSSETSGTWTSNPYSIFNSGCAGSNAQDYLPDGTYSGSYSIVNNTFLAYQVVYPNGSPTSVGYTVSVDVRGNTMNFVDNRTSPNPVVSLTRQ